MADVHAFGLVVVDPRQVENLTVAFDRDVLVPQDAYAQLGEVLAPARGVGVIFVIAGHEEGAKAGGQPGQGRDLARQVFHGRVDEIAGDRDDVGDKSFTIATTLSTNARPMTGPT